MSKRSRCPGTNHQTNVFGSTDDGVTVSSVPGLFPSISVFTAHVTKWSQQYSILRAHRHISVIWHPKKPHLTARGHEDWHRGVQSPSPTWGPRQQHWRSLGPPRPAGWAANSTGHVRPRSPVGTMYPGTTEGTALATTRLEQLLLEDRHGCDACPLNMRWRPRGPTVLPTLSARRVSPPEESLLRLSLIPQKEAILAGSEGSRSKDGCSSPVRSHDRGLLTGAGLRGVSGPADAPRPRLRVAPHTYCPLYGAAVASGDQLCLGGCPRSWRTLSGHLEVDTTRPRSGKTQWRSRLLAWTAARTSFMSRPGGGWAGCR